jgi:uncharacterized protein
MRTLLAVGAHLVQHRPRLTLAALAAVTVVLGGLATQQRADTDLTAFAPDSELAQAFDRVQDEFAAGGARVQVVVDAGAGGDVLAPEGVAAARRIEQLARGFDLADGERAVSSYATPVLGAAAVADLDLEDPAVVDAVAAELFAGPAASAASLLSSDLDLGAGTARAGLVVLELAPRLTDAEAQQTGVAFAKALDELSLDGVSAAAFSPGILAEAMQEESQREMPRLLALSMLLILGILFLQYRTVSDVVLGMVGLVVTITWMFGIAVLLGPDVLGITGPFTQISMIVPVLLIGLGIDYAIHLTSRYREERRHGLAPPTAASMAVHTVGGALVLATMTTMVGFLTNVVSPLPPIADFGIFTAVGVLSAFTVMALLVPSARRLLDQRPRALERARRRPADATKRPTRRLADVMGRTAAVAERAPRLTLLVALVVTAAAALVGTRIETSFSQADFIPEGSPSGELIAAMDELFGGDVSESTYVLVEGDLADPRLAGALADAPVALAGVDDVRAADGRAEVSSPVSVLGVLAAEDPAFAAAAEPLGLRGSELAPDADVAGLYDLARGSAPGLVGGLLAPDGEVGLLVVATSAGQERAFGLAAALDDATAPLRDAGAATTVVSESLVLEETLDALTSSQTTGIVVTLLGALALLVSFYGLVERRPLLGVIAMVPSAAVVGWVLGTMVLLGISFNVMTAMVASLGIGIGVPFGIHVTHRFLEDRRRYDTIDEAIRQTVTHTGAAMAGSAATTAAGFGVLALASLVPIQQFGIIVAITILYSLVAAVLVQPSCLKLWGEWRARRGELATLLAHEQRLVEVADAPATTPRPGDLPVGR